MHRQLNVALHRTAKYKKFLCGKHIPLWKLILLYFYTISVRLCGMFLQILLLKLNYGLLYKM